jgi:hypothetical protein
MKMPNHFTYKQSVRKFGGIKKMRSEFDAIAKKNGIEIFVEHQFNEEEPEDENQDWANILFYYHAESKAAHAGFVKAKDDVESALYRKGLYLVYECNGDGDNRIVMSYRVKSY